MRGGLSIISPIMGMFGRIGRMARFPIRPFNIVKCYSRQLCGFHPLDLQGHPLTGCRACLFFIGNNDILVCSYGKEYRHFQILFLIDGNTNNELHVTPVFIGIDLRNLPSNITSIGW